MPLEDQPNMADVLASVLTAEMDQQEAAARSVAGMLWAFYAECIARGFSAPEATFLSSEFLKMLVRPTH